MVFNRFCLFVLLAAVLPVASADDHPEWTQRGRAIWGGNLHEPLAFYRRENRTMAGVAANALWLEDWYKKVRSEQTIEQLAEMGVNILYVNFAKGAGENAAYEDLAGAKDLVTRCRRHGIRTMAYIQFPCQVTEELFVTRPESRGWLKRDRFGRPEFYGGTRYYRQYMCPMNPGYVEYLKALIQKAVVDYNMDGVFLDNFYYRPCYCTHCQRRFKAFVKSRFPDPVASLGVANLDGVRIPEVESKETSVTDRLHQAWVDWRVSVLPEVAESLRSYAKRLKPEVAFCGNICYSRMDNWHLRGTNPHRFLRVFDISYAESSRSFPRWEGGIAINNATVLLMGCSAGANVLSGTWLPGTVLPKTAEQIELFLGEPLAFGGQVLAGIWALRMKGREFARNEDELSDPYFTRAEIGQPWARYNRFLLEHETLYAGSKLDCPLALYHSAKSMAYDFGTAYPAFVNGSQALLQAQIPFGILFSEDIGKLKNHGTLLVCSQRCLSSSEIAAFSEFVSEGGNLIVTGGAGLYDEVRRERKDYGLKHLTGASLFDRPVRDVYRNTYGKGKVVLFPSAPELVGVKATSTTVRRAVPDSLEMVMDTVRTHLRSELKIRAQTPPSVFFTVFETAGGNTVTHLLNYNNEKVLKKIVLLLPEASPLRSAKPRAFSPDEKQYANIEEESPGRWVLAELKTYTCVLWE